MRLAITCNAHQEAEEKKALCMGIGKSSEPRTEPKMRQQCAVKPLLKTVLYKVKVSEVGVSARITDKLLQTYAVYKNITRHKYERQSTLLCPMLTLQSNYKVGIEVLLDLLKRDNQSNRGRTQPKILIFVKKNQSFAEKKS